jgi:hypothetical protein
MFTEGIRLWRRNLAEISGDGEITGQDGVDSTAAPRSMGP